jgi:hypothetical protein
MPWGNSFLVTGSPYVRDAGMYAISLAAGRNDRLLKALRHCIGFSGLPLSASPYVRVSRAIARKAQGILGLEFEIPCASLGHAMAACARSPRHKPLELIFAVRYIGRVRTTVTPAERALAERLLDFLTEFCLGVHRAMDAYVTDVTISAWGVATGTDPADITAADAFSAYDSLFMGTLARKADEIAIAIYKDLDPRT